MDDALPVDHHRHLLQGQAIEPHGLDDLQALVHQRGAVHGDLGAHGPVGVAEGVRSGHFAHFLRRHAVKGPAGAGEDQSFDLPPVGAALEALEDGGVLRIHRHDLRPVCIRRVHHQLAGADQRLLIGQGDALLLPDGGQGGLQPHHTHHGGDHRVRLGADGGLQQGLRPAQNADVRVRQAHRQVLCRRLVCQHRQPRAEFSRLGLQPLRVGIGGEGGHPQPQLLRHVQRLPPDGAGGP